MRYFRGLKENTKRHDAPGLDRFQVVKEGTPTMGGIFMISSIVLSVLFWAGLSNLYINFTLIVCVFLAILGWIDDYVKLAQKGPHRVLPARTKLFYQLVLGLCVGWYLYYFNPDMSPQLDVPFLKNV